MKIFEWKKVLRKSGGVLPASCFFWGPVDPDTAALFLRELRESRKAPLLVITPGLMAAEQLRSDFNAWNGFLSDGERVNAELLPEGSPVESVISSADAPRAKILHAELTEPCGMLFTSVEGFLGPAPAPDSMRKSELELRVGDVLEMGGFLKELLHMNYDDEAEVTVPGEFARRGGLTDVYSPAEELPARVEFFGDRVESIRLFQPETQRSVRKTESYRVILRSGNGASVGESEITTFEAYLKKSKRIPILLYPEQIRAHLKRFSPDLLLPAWEDFLTRLPKNTVRICDAAETAEYPNARNYPCYAAGASLTRGKTSGSEAEETGEAFSELARQMSALLVKRYLSEGYHVTVLARSESGFESVREWLQENGIASNGENLELAEGEVPTGVTVPGAKFALLTEHDLYASPKRKIFTSGKKDAKAPSAVNQHRDAMTGIVFPDLNEGDYAVHLDYGICLFRGLKVTESGGVTSEMIELEFDDDRVLEIPIRQAYLLNRYVGSKNSAIALSKLNSSRWGKAKAEAAASVRSLAFDMLRLQAARNAANGGCAFPPDDLAQHVFEQSFPFQETPDQLRSAEEIKRDMESSKPMDRLLCGDVGYGKTELAMRAAFKCVMSGKQAAVLVPTTILAQQHYYSFLERFAGTPVIIEQLSRFRTKGEQAQIIQRLREGKIDIVIGTHRLVQGDVEFKDLGLIVIDEEQRFGVEHKERLKRLRATVDILTMTATPIPRTLYLSMAGIRDMSTLMSAPVHRLPVRTCFAQYEPKLIRKAISGELERGGQVYFLHNRVKTIDAETERLRAMFPDVPIAAAHGQMSREELESIMSDFIEQKIKILVCTTIIESGLDIPNANTIIIDRADRFGLAELYQLRGRVGRWTRQAYAWMLLPPSGVMSGDARKRISALRKYTNLGAGFQLAVSDLEIRGAGNILGEEQSGQINAVGFHLYCDLLKACTEQLKGEAEAIPTDPELYYDFLDFGLATEKPGNGAACILPTYIEDGPTRFQTYKRLGGIRSETELDLFESELTDRFGTLPEQTELLLLSARIGILASKLKLDSVSAREGRVYLERGRTILKPGGFVPRLDPTGRDPAGNLRDLLTLLRSLGETQRN